MYDAIIWYTFQAAHTKCCEVLRLAFVFNLCTSEWKFVCFSYSPNIHQVNERKADGLECFQMCLPLCSQMYDVLGSKRMCHRRVDSGQKQASNLRTKRNWCDSCDVVPTTTKWTDVSHHCHGYLRLPSAMNNQTHATKVEWIENC